MTESLQIRRLDVDDVLLARRTFHLMTVVFEEEPAPLSDGWLASLLRRPDFWAVAALYDGTPIGGITAHTLPMTRSESYELFIYDLAVDETHQRQGIGRQLVRALQTEAAAQGITVSFVPADHEDLHALDFYRAIGGSETPVSIFDWRSPPPG
jgi:aminoglycoside 3-N-acetyltransferase I